MNRTLVKQILKRDNYTCQDCGKVFKEDGVWPDTHHILPKHDGGEDAPENLITLCEECHHQKHLTRPYLKGKKRGIRDPNSKRPYVIMVSCPKGKEHHDKLKKAFPNLSRKIMGLIDAELLRVEAEARANELRAKYIDILVYPEVKKLIGLIDPFRYEPEKVVEMLRQNEITITEKDAEYLINKLQNEAVERDGG